MLSLKVWWHKHQVRKIRTEICNLLSSYTCGIGMINTITGGEYNHLVNVYNKHILWLKENDPKYPHTK